MVRGIAKKQDGQTLLEVLLAFSISIMALSAIILGVVTSLSNAQYSKNQGLATSYATEGLTAVRKIRDSSWNTFSGLYTFSSNKKYCIDEKQALQDATSITANCSDDGYGVGDKIGGKGTFSREVKFEHNSSDCCPNSGCPTPPPFTVSKVTVKVSWTDNKCAIGAPYCHNVQLISCFSNTDLKSTP